MISKINLGTVQFGQDYGIANMRGKVSRDEVFEILDYAKRVGINCLDTASGYGESESVIGGFLKDYEARFDIISKMKVSGHFSNGLVEEEAQRTLGCLNQESIYGYLIHKFDDFIEYEGLWSALEGLKQKGIVEKIGFSLYCPQEVDEILDRGIFFDILQIPYSVFDRRFEKYFEDLKRRNVEILARSVFLQGAVFLPEDNLPAYLKKAEYQIKELNRISKEVGVSISTICINFALLNSFVDKIVIGVDSLEQLKKNVTALDSCDVVRGVYDQLKNVEVNDEDVCLPYKWNAVSLESKI